MSKNFRLLAFSFTALISGALGWWLHGPGKSETAHTEAANSTIASGSGSASIKPSAAFDGSRSVSTIHNASGASLENATANQTRIAETMERVFNTDSEDIIDMMDGFGSLTGMTDAEVRIAWGQLSRRVPSNNFGGGLTAMYLWRRMWQMGEKVDLPIGWGMEDFEVALASEKARHEGEESSEKILSRLESGEPVSNTERRVLFGQAVRANPLEAVKLWCRVTNPADYERDAPWLYTALTEPGSRDAIMLELRKWQTGENLAGAVTSLARNWIDRDPEAVERWLQQPTLADIKDAVMKEVIGTRASANPIDTWAWSRSLPDQERRQALGISAAQFASVGPQETEMGIQMIAGLQNAEDRLEAVGKFGEILAGNDINRWKQWRDTLSPTEQQRVNEISFDYWASSDVTAAVEWLKTRPSGDAKNNMVSKLASLYAKNDPQTAVQLIRGIPDTARRQEAVSVALTTVGPDNLDLVQTILNGFSGN